VIPPVVDQNWLSRHRDVVVADVRWYLDGRSGQAAYTAAHLPGAVYVNLDEWLAAPASVGSGRHPLPDPERFALGMATVGVGDGDTVVAYDDGGGVIAARLVWMLRVIGHDAALLDGGLGAYDGPLESVATLRPRATFTPRAWPPDRIVDLEGVRDTGSVVVDARDRGRYRGEPDPVDARSGHIPGAKSVPCRENLGADGTFLPIAELRERFAAVGVTDGAEVVSYCGSGVTACHNLLALEYAGFGPGRLYPGSWSQYAAVGDLPIATGDLPG
jgi:thiosulfate/3-mercaptopyruvate sulfurtransferase